MNEEKSNKKSWKNMFIIFILIASFVVGGIFYNTYANEETYTGEFIRANKVYMPDNNIKLVIYFNETGDNIHFKVFDNWDARHSILLSNMVEGDRVKIVYREYVFRDCKEIVGVEVL